MKTCTDLNCPERKSVCCYAPGRTTKTDIFNYYFCAECGEKFVPQKCTATVPISLEFLQEKMVIEFDEKVNEVRRENPYEDEESTTHEFGYKLCKGGDIFTITDFVNIKKFIKQKQAEAWEAALKQRQIICERGPKKSHHATIKPKSPTQFN